MAMFISGIETASPWAAAAAIQGTCTNSFRSLTNNFPMPI
jgi:hypothetical protein